MNIIAREAIIKNILHPPPPTYKEKICSLGLLEWTRAYILFLLRRGMLYCTANRRSQKLSAFEKNGWKSSRFVHSPERYLFSLSPEGSRCSQQTLIWTLPYCCFCNLLTYIFLWLYIYMLSMFVSSPDKFSCLALWFYAYVRYACFVSKLILHFGHIYHS